MPDGDYCLIIAKDVTELGRLNRLLNIINSIDKLIVREKDKKRLLEKACEKLAMLEDYSTTTICVVEDEEVVPIAISGVRKNVLEKQRECKVIKEAVKCKSIVAKDEKNVF